MSGEKRTPGIKLENKLVVLALSIVACAILAFYFSFVVHKEVVYTHFFYIPIILAGLWYQRKAVYIALVLGLVHILVTLLSPLTITVAEFGRAIIFVIIAYVIGFVSEKRAEGEEALRVSEERYRILFNSGNDAMFIHPPVLDGKPGKFIEVNEVACQLLGYKREELLQLSHLDIIAPEELSNVPQIREELFVEKENCFEIDVVTKDGRKITLEINIRLFNLNGQPTVLSIARDITERKRAEEALRTSEKQQRETKDYLDNIIKSSVDAIVVVDMEGIVRGWNKGAEDYMGYTADEVIGTSNEKFFADPEEPDRIMELVRMEGEIKNYRTNVLSKYGKPVHISMSATFLRDKEGVPIGTVRVSRDITKEVELEERIKEERNNLNSIFENMTDGVYLVSEEYKVEFMNKVLISAFGDKVGSICYKEFHNREKPCPLCKSAEVMKGKTVRWEWFSSRANKTYDLIETPLRNADGTISKLTIFRDITDRKRAEEALQKSEEKWRSLVENAPNLVLIVDHDSKIQFINRVPSGFDDEAVIGTSIYDYILPEYHDVVRMTIKRVFETREHGSYEIAGLGPDRSISWYETQVGPIEHDGQVVAVTLISLDITERKRSEEALRQSEEKLRLMFETLPEGITILDTDGKIVQLNKATAHIYGYDNEEEIIGLNIFEFIAKKDLTRVTEIMKNTLKEGYLGAIRLTQLRKDRSEFPAEVSGTALKDASGNPIGFITIMKDITERKRAEEEREILLKELEAKNRELEHFTYTVSHDLRSPLVTIQGFTNMLQQDLEENNQENAENDLKYIKNAATKMDGLLNDLLKLSRIGRIANPPEDVPFGEIAKGALEQTAEQIKSSGVAISVADDFPTVHVDRTRMEEVLVNLIGNSIKYRGEQPQPAIEIGHRAEGKETVFFVKDNGMGIDKSLHEKVFELFFRVNTSGEGTGAGLAIVKRVIAVHRGRIWIESEEGKGCKVCFTLSNGH